MVVVDVNVGVVQVDVGVHGAQPGIHTPGPGATAQRQEESVDAQETLPEPVTGYSEGDQFVPVMKREGLFSPLVHEAVDHGVVHRVRHGEPVDGQVDVLEKECDCVGSYDYGIRTSCSLDRAL